MYDKSLLNGSVFIDGKFIKTNVYISHGKFEEITPQIFPAKETIDCTNLKIIPGLIDPHVHFNLNLGEFTSADDFESGSIAAAYGGVTTFIDFLDPIYNHNEFESAFKNRLSLAKESVLDYSFHTALGNYKGLVPPLTKQCLDNGITSIKVFTTYSESNRKCPIDVIESLLSSPLTILSHSEEDSLVISDWNTISDYESSRPVSSELRQIEELSQIARKTNGNLYIVHTTCGSTLEMLQEKYSDILYKNLMIESCPQYFYLTKDIFKRENGYLYLLAPPLRSKEEQTKLKENIDNIYSIGTDHCPFMKSEKERYPLAYKVPKGLGSIEYSFLLMHNLFGDKIIEKMSKNPAKAFHLKNKGEIKVGKDADLFILNPNNETTITSGHSKSDYSPYEGIKLRGKIISTMSRGEFVIKEQQLIKHRGMFIRRNLK